MKHTLSIYHISVYERRKRDRRTRLNDIDGTDLIDVIDRFIDYWLKGPVSLWTPGNENKAFRLGVENGHFLYERRGRIIDGIIESGEYGQEFDIYDTTNGRKTGTVERHHAPLLPFYFLFFIPDESYDGYLILQKISNSGIFTILTSEFLDYASHHVAGDYTISINPFAIASLRDSALDSLHQARSITIRQQQIPNLLESLGLGNLEKEGARNEIKYTMPRGGLFKISDTIKGLLKGTGKSNEREGAEDGIGVRDVDISLEVKMPDEKFRTISFASIHSLGTSLTIPADCAKNAKGFPSMGVLKSEAMRLIRLIGNNHRNDSNEENR